MRFVCAIVKRTWMGLPNRAWQSLRFQRNCPGCWSSWCPGSAAERAGKNWNVGEYTSAYARAHSLFTLIATSIGGRCATTSSPLNGASGNGAPALVVIWRTCAPRGHKSGMTKYAWIRKERTHSRNLLPIVELIVPLFGFFKCTCSLSRLSVADLHNLATFFSAFACPEMSLRTTDFAVSQRSSGVVFLLWNS